MPEEGRVKVWVEQVKGIKSQIFSYKISHGDLLYSIGNIVNNTAIILYGDSFSIAIIS